jgi:polysaccharide biosynthesis/export protein
MHLRLSLPNSERAWAYVWLWSLLACATGCVQSMYSAANLPPQYLAPPPKSAQHLDLSVLSGRNGNSEFIGAGDTVEVSIATGVESGPTPKWMLRVSDQGMLDVPLVGPVPIQGIAATDAESRIRDESIRRGVYISPKVTVVVAQPRTFRITIAGAVNEPGTYELPASGCDVLAALAKAKGLSVDADTSVEVRHPASGLNVLAANEVPDVNGVVQASSQSGYGESLRLDISQPQAIAPSKLQLHDGSVVMVLRQPKRRVNVDGLVKTPKSIDMPEDLTLLDAVAQAGGTTLTIADRVQIVRRVDHQSNPVVISASLRKARNGMSDNLLLAPGDIVSVEETPSTFVLDSIRTFFRVGFAAAIPGL